MQCSLITHRLRRILQFQESLVIDLLELRQSREATPISRQRGRGYYLDATAAGSCGVCWEVRKRIVQEC